MTAVLCVLEKFFPVQRHEWPKALALLGVATLLGMAGSVSRAASEALFLTRFGVEFLPYLLLVNPILIFIATTVYGAFADRLPNDRMLMYTALLPVGLILVLRVLVVLELGWVYFLLYAFVLSYAAISATSWTVYLSGHYDVQEAKRLLPFIASGMLIGTVIGGLGVALSVSMLGTANMLVVWIGLLVAVALGVHSIGTFFTSLDAETRKGKRVGQRTSVVQNFKEGLAYSRTSSLFVTTAVVSIATMLALQLIDFEYSKVIARTFPDSHALTAFLGVFDGLSTVAALFLQWFLTPYCIRRFGVQGTNLLFPMFLSLAFGGILLVSGLPPAMFARFTRTRLMPSLRGATRTLILNAVPRKMAARVRSFNTGVVMPLGQGTGALTLLILKGLDIPPLFPALGLVVAATCVYLSLRQNRAYSKALLELLKEDKIHLLDLEDDEIRQLDASAVAAISARLKTDQAEIAQMPTTLPEEQGEFLQAIASAQEETSLGAIELLRAIGSPQAFAALHEHLPYASPRLNATALEAMASIGGNAAKDILSPYLNDPEPSVRVAALAGLRRLRDPALGPRVAALLDDPDLQVRAVALSVVLTDTDGATHAHAMQIWETMLEATDTATQTAALSIFATVPPSPMQGYLYRALDHADPIIRREALRVLGQLANAGRIPELDAALLRVLEDEDSESRELALQVVAAIGTDVALEHLLVLLDDEQLTVRETLVNAIQRFGKRAIEPLMRRLRASQTSLIAKESALAALAHLDGVQADQLLPFWEDALLDVYQYKLMLAYLDEHDACDADAFLRVALHNAHDQILSLLIQLLGVWSSPEVARLIESGLHDPDRSKRANALEALESLSERRFTRLFFPILEAVGTETESWREVAEQHWHLGFADVPAVVHACLQSSDKWIVIGALLAGYVRADAMGATWTTQLDHLLEASTDAEVRNTARRLLGQEVEALHGCLSLTDVMLFLKRLPLYRSLSLDQLHTISTHLTEREVAAGEVIFHEGDLSYELYLIVSGQVDIRQMRGETEQTLATLSAGEFFGDMAIFENRPRSASVVAVEQSVLLVLSPERFHQIILQDPAISFEIFRELSARLRRFDEEPVGATR